jgi:hypothetical protein
MAEDALGHLELALANYWKALRILSSASSHVTDSRLLLLAVRGGKDMCKHQIRAIQRELHRRALASCQPHGQPATNPTPPAPLPPLGPDEEPEGDTLLLP